MRGAFETETEVHVVPLRDEREHVTSGMACHCKPRVEWVFSARLYGSRSHKNKRLIEGIEKEARHAQGA
jgi:predicted site-specific integrase-resolvase